MLNVGSMSYSVVVARLLSATGFGSHAPITVLLRQFRIRSQVLLICLVAIFAATLRKIASLR